MKMVIKTSRAAALSLLQHFAEVEEFGDSYSRTSSVVGVSAEHTTCGGNRYFVHVEDSHGIVEFQGSRTSLMTGSLALDIRPTFTLVDGFEVDNQELKSGDHCRLNGLLGRVVSVSSSLPSYCPMAEDAWASDHEIHDWLAAESAADQFEEIFEPIAAHVATNGHTAAAYI